MNGRESTGVLRALKVSKVSDRTNINPAEKRDSEFSQRTSEKWLLNNSPPLFLPGTAGQPVTLWGKKTSSTMKFELVMLMSSRLEYHCLPSTSEVLSNPRGCQFDTPFTQQQSPRIINSGSIMLETNISTCQRIISLNFCNSYNFKVLSLELARGHCVGWPLHYTVPALLDSLFVPDTSVSITIQHLLDGQVGSSHQRRKTTQNCLDSVLYTKPMVDFIIKHTTNKRLDFMSGPL